ncbi:MAG: peptidoglycan editing factor PgeF [Acidocella sp.]|nr:peptidoglycan editing factor PgeF [Acidocella sp.]
MTEFFTGSLKAKHGFFTRNGGVSAGLYASLNCSFSSDNPNHVRENRARVAAAMGVEREHLLGVKQVHGDGVVTVREPWAEGAGPAADALVTSIPGLALGIITADCAPVLFYGDGVVGAAHAGWRGALAGVLEATATAMRELGAREIHAVIGPCIGQASYEVGADMRDAVLARHATDAQFFEVGRPGHWHFDLPGYCAARLNAAGVKAEALGLDTYAQEQEFFSYRRKTLRGEVATGHQISVIRL